MIKQLAAILLALGLVSGAKADPAYSLRLLDTLGGSASYANGINDRGQVVGWSLTERDEFQRATLWSNGTTTDLGTLGGINSYAFGINSGGQIAGWSYTTNGRERATIWNGITPTELPPPFGGSSLAYGINDSGQVVGRTTISATSAYLRATIWNGTIPTDINPNGFVSSGLAINNLGQVVGLSYVSVTGDNSLQQRAYLWDNTTSFTLSTLHSIATSINDQGQIVGTSVIPSGDQNIAQLQRATLWTSTTELVLGTLSGHSAAFGINNSGQIVGQSFAVDGLPRATIWKGTTAVDLNSLLNDSDAASWYLFSATAINNTGSIVGNAANVFTGEQRAFVMSVNPVPAPATIALLALGVVGIVAARRMQASSGTSGDLA